MGCVRVCRQVEEIEREKRGAAKEGKKNLLPLPFGVKGKRKYTVLFKTTLFWGFFIYTNSE
jgi:hypothetical protein